MGKHIREKQIKCMVELPESSVTFDLNVGLENYFRALRAFCPCLNLRFIRFQRNSQAH